jgi:hypothetical protein
MAYFSTSAGSGRRLLTLSLFEAIWSCFVDFDADGDDLLRLGMLLLLLLLLLLLTWLLLADFGCCFLKTSFP